MKRTNSILTVIIFLAILINNKAYAQSGYDKLTNQEKEITVDSISNKLVGFYIFPDVAEEMSDHIRENLKKGKYNSINNPNDFADQLTADLLSISQDKHIHVEYDPVGIKAQNEVFTVEDSLNYLKRYINDIKRDNFGFKELKILGGNIGYLDLRSFSDVEYAGPTAVSAMNFLSNSDAIIIDLRRNGGGRPAMIQLITSYLFESDPVHLNNFYWRPNNETTQTWTLPYVQGTRFPNTPVYLLTSNRTFSAAEEFSYNLKHLKRATIIGETTGGGAHPGGPVIATDKFSINIPFGRAINPITKTNWEGVGVTPHIEVPASQALELAQIKALETLIQASKENEINKGFYVWHLEGLEAIMEPVLVDTTILKSYIGNYGPRMISLKDNNLYYQREGTEIQYKLIPLSDKEFMLKENSSIRLRFIVENGQALAVEGLYDNGRSDKSPKTES
jgi:hypothetical protein